MRATSLRSETESVDMLDACAPALHDEAPDEVIGCSKRPTMHHETHNIADAGTYYWRGGGGEGGEGKQGRWYPSFCTRAAAHVQACTVDRGAHKANLNNTFNVVRSLTSGRPSSLCRQRRDHIKSLFSRCDLGSGWRSRSRRKGWSASRTAGKRCTPGRSRCQLRSR